MFNFKNTFIFIALLLFSTSSFAKKQREVLPADQKKKIMGVLKVNEKLHMAFYKYNIKDIMLYTGQMKIKSSDVKGDKITKTLTAVNKSLNNISDKNRKKKNFKEYSKVSNGLKKLVKKYELDRYNVYYCPMIQKYWIQNSKSLDKVHNPYASYMPHCGAKVTRY